MISSLIGYLVGFLSVTLVIAGGFEKQGGQPVAGAILVLAGMIVLMNFLHWNERKGD